MNYAAFLAVILSGTKNTSKLDYTIKALLSRWNGGAIHSRSAEISTPKDTAPGASTSFCGEQVFSEKTRFQF